MQKKMRAKLVYFPARWFQIMDKIVEAGLYPNANEFIRMAVRDRFKALEIFLDLLIEENTAHPITELS